MRHSNVHLSKRGNTLFSIKIGTCIGGGKQNPYSWPCWLIVRGGIRLRHLERVAMCQGWVGWKTTRSSQLASHLCLSCHIWRVKNPRLSRKSKTRFSTAPPKPFRTLHMWCRSPVSGHVVFKEVALKTIEWHRIAKSRCEKSNLQSIKAMVSQRFDNFHCIAITRRDRPIPIAVIFLYGRTKLATIARARLKSSPLWI